MPITIFLFWFLLIWLAGWAFLPISRRVWGNNLPDCGLAAGRVLSLCLLTLPAFWLGHAGVATKLSAMVIFPVFIFGAFQLWRERTETRSTLFPNRRAVWASEIIFCSVFLLFFGLRGFWPDTANGEKPMDMALIAACARAEYLPPPNTYAAGERLRSYYYFGHLQTALLTNAVFSSPRWTYNLMCATLPALIFSSLFSLCAALSGRLKLGVWAMLGVLCLGTLEPLRQFAPAVFGERLHPESYVATSRVIPFTINEYPFFTFCFADLHAHFFAMPLAILAMSLAWALWNTDRSTPLLLCGLVLGALAMTNTWDLPLYFLLTIIAVWQRRQTPGRKIAATLALIAITFAASAPFWWQLQSSASKIHFALPSSPVPAWLLIWGVFMAALLACSVLRARSESNYVWSLVVCGLLALLWSEVAWAGFLSPPYHRQDMVFKFGLQAWYFLGTAAACLSLRQILQRQWPPFLPLLFLPLLSIMLWSSVLVVAGRSRDFHKFEGWDAWAHLNSSEQSAAQWLQERARSGDSLMEAEEFQGGDYSEYSRYAHATGIPIVIGPQAHSFQWTGSWNEVLRRKREVREFYTTGKQSQRQAILQKYAVRWIICGELERREYGAEFIERVENALPVVARFGSVVDAHRVIICENPLLQNKSTS